MTTRLILLGSLFLFLSACIEEDFFGLSSFGEIKNIEVSNQAAAAKIESQTKTIEIEIPGGVPLNTNVIQSLELSSFATSIPTIGDTINLNQPATILVTAEDGTLTTWIVEAFVASSTPQVDNGDFDLWYQTNAGYFEPGESASTTIWGSGNPGSALINRIPTTPFEFSDDNLAARLETLDNGTLGSIAGTPISAATIFTGRFNTDNIDPSDPEAAVELGTPFAGRPKAFSLNYFFQPGPENKDRQGNLLPDPDECRIFMLLEVRNGGSSKRLATAWFESSESTDELTKLKLDLTYGPLDNSFPDEAFPEDGFVSIDSASFILPTHLSFLATSSKGGASFTGAIGSLLIIDDLEMIYE